MEVLENRTIEELIQQGMANGVSYGEYREKVEDLVEKGKSTGQNQTEALTQYTLLNNRRMKRWGKTIKIGNAIASKMDKKVTWLVLTESWCADAAHSMPIMNKIAETDPNITFKVLLRDENLELMHHFLTKGTLSIPKLIMVDDETGKVLGDWGPRPSTASDMVEAFKAEYGKLTPEFKQELQVWYNKDKGQNVLGDLVKLLALE